MTQAAGRLILMVVRGLDAVGTGRQIELVAAGFRAAGWRVHIAVTTSGGTVAERLGAAGFPVHRLGARPRVDPGAAAKLPFVVRSVGPCVIHAWGRSQARIVGGLRGLLRPARTVCHLAVGPRDRFTAWSLRRADRVIVTSAGVAGRCEAFGVRSGLIDIIPPGIDAAAGTTRSREEIAHRLGLRGDSPWTLCVAPLDAEARLERLLWAIDQLDVVHRGVEHVLVGAGPLQPRLMRRARVQQLAERLHVMPHCDMLPDLLAQVRLVWQSGDVAYGGALLDALPHGIPTVAVASDAARQFIEDDRNGRIVPADPESEFPRRAFNILEDEALAGRYGTAARIRAAEAFPLAPALERHIAAVERLLS